jgi:hypothetical protein
MLNVDESIPLSQNNEDEQQQSTYKNWQKTQTNKKVCGPNVI